MTISLTEIIAALEAKANSTDSASSISDVLRLSIGSEAVSDGIIFYDSAGVLPTGTDWIGTIATTSDGTLYVYDQYDGWISSMQRSPFVYQGETYGYASAGQGTPNQNFGKRVEQITFASDGNSTNVGNWNPSISLTGGVGVSSRVAAYMLGYYSSSKDVWKMPFASTSNATSSGLHGEMLTSGGRGAGTNNEFYGFKSGGRQYTPTVFINNIEKYTFSTETDATDVGDLTRIVIYPSGQSSETHGYSSGGQSTTSPGTIYQAIIDKFPFSADGNATDVGDLIRSTVAPLGQSSTTHGYISGGFDPGLGQFNEIQKFPFISDANTTDVGDLTEAGSAGQGLSSTTHGYRTGGYGTTPPVYRNIIEKFSFTADGNATDVGDLSITKFRGHSNQI